MLGNEQMPNKKKKKPGLLSEKMGLDRGSDMFKPSAPKPELFGSPESELNTRNNDAVGNKIQEKMKNRKLNGG